MSIMDATLVFADEQALTDSADLTNHVDMAVANANKGEGTPLILHVVATADFADGTSIVFELMDSADDSTFDEILVSETYLVAEALKGVNFFAVSIPANHRRYLKVHATIVGTMTAGAVNAWIDLDNKHI